MAPGDEERDTGPYVCPGCYAIGGEPCAAYCPDAAIERERQREREELPTLEDDGRWWEEEGDHGDG